MRKLFVAVALALVLGGCRCASSGCPSDAELEAMFSRIAGKLTRLRELMAEDGYRVYFVADGRIAAHGPPLTKEREAQYLAVMAEIGRVRVTQSEGELNVFAWIMGGRTLASPEQSKGFVYVSEARRTIITTRPSLDGLQHGGRDGVYLKWLSDGWLMFFYQSS